MHSLLVTFGACFVLHCVIFKAGSFGLNIRLILPLWDLNCVPSDPKTVDLPMSQLWFINVQFPNGLLSHLDITIQISDTIQVRFLMFLNPGCRVLDPSLELKSEGLVCYLDLVSCSRNHQNSSPIWDLNSYMHKCQLFRPTWTLGYNFCVDKRLQWGLEYRTF